MTGKEITTQLQEVFQMKDGRSRASQLDYQFVSDNLPYYRQQGRIDYRAFEMMAGILWAYKTGRLTCEAEKAIRNMKALQFVRLIGRASDNCSVQGEIPKWLNSTLS